MKHYSRFDRESNCILSPHPPCGEANRLENGCGRLETARRCSSMTTWMGGSCEVKATAKTAPA